VALIKTKCLQLSGAFQPFYKLQPFCTNPPPKPRPQKQVSQSDVSKPESAQ